MHFFLLLYFWFLQIPPFFLGERMKKTVWRGWGADNTKWQNALIKCCISFSLFWTKKKEKWPDQSLQKGTFITKCPTTYNVLPFYMPFYLLMPLAHKPPFSPARNPPELLANFVLQLCEFGSYIFQGVLLMKVLHTLQETNTHRVPGPAVQKIIYNFVPF